MDSDFHQCIEQCAQRSETWISDEIMTVYSALHEMGYAHSFEAWKDGVMQGGLYGVRLGSVFFGESMFHKATDASKVCLVYLIDWMNKKAIQLLDCQFITEHLMQFGAKEIPQKEYLKLLQKALP